MVAPDALSRALDDRLASGSVWRDVDHDMGHSAFVVQPAGGVSTVSSRSVVPSGGEGLRPALAGGGSGVVSDVCQVGTAAQVLPVSASNSSVQTTANGPAPAGQVSATSVFSLEVEKVKAAYAAELTRVLGHCVCWRPGRQVSCRCKTRAFSTITVCGTGCCI